MDFLGGSGEGNNKPRLSNWYHWARSGRLSPSGAGGNVRRDKCTMVEAGAAFKFNPAACDRMASEQDDEARVWDQRTDRDSPDKISGSANMRPIKRIRK